MFVLCYLVTGKWEKLRFPSEMFLSKKDERLRVFDKQSITAGWEQMLHRTERLKGIGYRKVMDTIIKCTARRNHITNIAK